ncbi:MAG: DUF4238 domain-containing protein [Deltaproteobacteria bacterium]|nr:DUF4238 domain-containing protein [Deltaproteobacteria bacterium]
MPKRQHILPRLLLKGFASRKTKSEVYSFVYSKEKDVYETNIINIAVESGYYSIEGNCEVDDQLTKLENGFGRELDKIRSAPFGQEITGAFIPTFVGNLAVRTKHFFETLEEPVLYMRNIMLEYFSKKENVIRLVVEKRGSLALPAGLKSMSDKDFAAFLQRLNFSKMEHFICLARQAMEDNIKRLYLQSLGEEIIPEKRVAMYNSFNWIKYRANMPLLLGDLGCVCEKSRPVRMDSLLFSSKDISTIYLPISSDQILVGSRGCKSIEVDYEALNREIAKLSRDYFVSAERLERFNEYRHLIGTSPVQDYREKIDKLAAEKLP